MSLLSFIHKSKKVKKLADQSKLFKNPKKIPQSRLKGTRYKDQFNSIEEYNQFLRDFSLQYKRLSPKGIRLLRKGMGDEFWAHVKLSARRKNYIDSDDTSRVAAQQDAYTKTKEIQLKMPKQKLKNQRRDALKEVWKEILDAAPKDKKTGDPILSGVRQLHPINTIPLLKKKFPELFSDIENIRDGQKVMSNLLRADNTFGKMNYPKFKVKDFNPDEKLLRNLFPKYTDNPQLVDEIDKQYMVDIWRSRTSDFRTGDFNKDVPNFLTWLRKQEFFNPRNEKTYFRSKGEYDDYALMRENQPKGMHLAHDVPTLNPEGYKSFPRGSTPFSGGEASKTQYLEPTLNLKTQPKLEQQYIGALADEDFNLMKKIDQEMLDKNIRSTIVNPNEALSDEELVQLFLNRNKIKQKFGVDFKDYLSKGVYTPGGTSGIGFSSGGLVKLLNKLKLTKKQRDLIMKTAYSPHRKPGTGPKLTRERRIEKKIRDLYGKEKRWKYVKSTVPGPKVKKSAGGILSHYVR